MQRGLSRRHGENNLGKYIFLQVANSQNPSVAYIRSDEREVRRASVRDLFQVM